MISNRLTAWENLLDSVSHVGPLTNNPSEAKRLLVIRPDQETPRAQMLSPDISEHEKRRQFKNDKKKKRKNGNKSSKKNNRKQIKQQARNSARRNANSSTKKLDSFGGRDSVNRRKNIGKARIFLLDIFFIYNR